MDFAIPDVMRYLEAYQPGEVVRLGAAWPEARAALKSNGLVLGAVEDDAVRDAVEAMLSGIGAETRKAVGQATATLRGARRLEVIGKLMAAASSSAVIGSSLVTRSTWLPSVFGAIAFLATLLPVGVNWLRAAPTGGTLAQKAVELRDLVWDAEALLAEIRRGDDITDWKTVLTKANRIGKKAYEALQSLGVDSAIAPV